MEKETFTFPASVQSDLFGYLKPHQQAILKPYLRLVKRPYQQKLCISLLDYLEGNGLDELQQPVLRSLQHHIIEVCNLHPLTTRDSRFFDERSDRSTFGRLQGKKVERTIHDSSEPKSIGTVIKQLFPSFSNS